MPVLRGVGGMQVNSLRGPTVPQASLAHHLTAIPDEGLRTSELVKQMSEQAREGGGVEGVHTAAAAPARPACLSAYISHQCPLSLHLKLFSFLPFLSMRLFLKVLSVSVSISVCLFPSLSCTRAHVIPLFY